MQASLFIIEFEPINITFIFNFLYNTQLVNSDW